MRQSATGTSTLVAMNSFTLNKINYSPPIAAPIIGNILQIPKTHTWIHFKQWADIYGPIYRFQVGSKNNIVVSTEKIANDLLRGRGNIYSSREFLYFATELLSKNLRPLLLPYNGTTSIQPFLACHYHLLIVF